MSNLKKLPPQADEHTQKLYDDVQQFLKDKVKEGAPQRTVRRMIEKEFGDRMLADIDRINALRGEDHDLLTSYTYYFSQTEKMHIIRIITMKGSKTLSTRTFKASNLILVFIHWLFRMQIIGSAASPDALQPIPDDSKTAKVKSLNGYEL